MISSSNEVVITGLGVVSPIGIGYEAFLAALASGQSGVRRLPSFDTKDFPVRIGGEVIDFDAKQYVTPRKSLKVMSRGIQLAFAAAQMSVDSAQLATSGVSPDRLGVVYGADMIQVEPDELVNAFRTCIESANFDFNRWDDRAIRELYPLWMLKYLPNMPACHVAISHDARGPNNTVVLSEASSLLAIGEATRVIERGAADVMIAGGTGSRIHPLSWMFRDHSLHSPRHELPERVSRPFDAARDGMVYGEGAAAIVLESLPHARARGAKILAYVSGFARAYEACTPGRPFAGHAIRTAISQSLQAAQIQSTELGHVNAHGLSTVIHDRVEAQAIHDTVGDVPVTALKSYFGNLGAGTGAVELIGSLAAFETGHVPPVLNFEKSDPTCPINVAASPVDATKKRTALVLNHTTMGQAVALVLRGV